MSTQTLQLPEINAQAQGWEGGVNIRDAINQLAKNEARMLENGILDERGGFTKRKGSISNGTFGSGSDRGISMDVLYRPGLVPHVLLQTSAGKLYYTTDPDANPVVWTQIATGLSATAPFSYERFSSKIYMSNGVDNYASWDGTTYVTYASAPKGKYLRLWKDTMWNSGITGLPDRVYASSPGDAETYPASSWVDIAKGDGDATSALGSDGQFLIVGKRDRTFTIYDPVTFANRVVDFEKGIESHYSVAQFEGNIYFLSRRGICLYLGDSPSRIISDKIDPLFSPELLALDQLWQSTVHIFENRMCWNVPESGQTHNTLGIEYYPRLGSLTAFGTRSGGPFAFQRLPTQCYVRVRSASRDRLYGCHSSANKFLQMYADIGTDDGVAFTATLETGPYDFGAAKRTKYLRDLTFLCAGRFNAFILRDLKIDLYRTISVDAAALIDTWNPSEVWGTGTWGPDSPVQEVRKTNIDAYARYFTFRFQDAGETGTGNKLFPVGSIQKTLVAGEWSIYGLIINGTVLGVRA